MPDAAVSSRFNGRSAAGGEPVSDSDGVAGKGPVAAMEMPGEAGRGDPAVPCEPRLAASKNVRIKYAQGETTDNAASDASTDHSMLDARDTAVMAERCPRLPGFALIQWRVWMKNGKTTVRKKLLRQPVCHQAFLVPHLAR